MADTSVERRTLRIVREFPVPPSAVYDAWAVPEQLVQWWGPDGMTIPDSEIDPQPGGKYITTMMNADGERFTVQGRYLAMNPPAHLRFTWAWIHEDGPGHETQIDVHLDATQAGTRMTFVQQVFAEAEHRDNHEGGWNSSFVCLARFLDGGESLP